MSERESKLIDMECDSHINKQKIQTGLDKYMLVKRKRSPKSAKLGPINQKVLKTNAEREGISTENRFNVLAVKKNNEQMKTAKIEKPPPFYVRGIDSVNSFINTLKKINEDFYIKILRGGAEIKVQAISVVSFKAIQNFLVEQKYAFHTFQLKSHRTLKVVIKGLHPKTDIELIKSELESMGYCPARISNIKNWKKEPLPMFLVELTPDQENFKNHPIYKINRLLYTVVTVEEPINKKSIVQCMNCQEFGHTKGYCTLASVCVICGELHNSKQCDKDTNNKEVRKCANCAENHTANYKGCAIFQHFRQKQHPKQNKTQVMLNKMPKENVEQVKPPGFTSYITPGISYAQAFQGSAVPQVEAAAQLNMGQIIQQMQQQQASFQKSMEEMMKNMMALIQMIVQHASK